MGKFRKTFKPRPSSSWCWLIFMAVIILAVGVAPALARGLTSSSTVLTSIILIPIALASIGFPLGWTIMAFEPKDEQISKEIVYRQR